MVFFIGYVQIFRGKEINKIIVFLVKSLPIGIRKKGYKSYKGAFGEKMAQSHHI
jgi:hypothetical protein